MARRVRGPVDKVGFAHLARQMDEVVRRIAQACPSPEKPPGPWRVVIAPHDDYAYAGCLYPPALANVKSKRSSRSSSTTTATCGSFRSSCLPCLARACATSRRRSPSRWRGRCKRAGGGGTGTWRETLEGDLRPGKTELFTKHTVREDDYREYKWTWCGRYSVPFGLFCAWHLQQELAAAPLSGQSLGYATSIDAPRIKVEDLDGMGVTAPANLRHWVGYAAVGYL